MCGLNRSGFVSDRKCLFIYFAIVELHFVSPLLLCKKKNPLKKDSSFLSRALFAVQFEFTVWMWGDYAVKDPFFSVEGSCLCGSKV